MPDNNPFGTDSTSAEAEAEMYEFACGQAVSAGMIGKFDEAVNATDRAVALDGGNPKAYVLRAYYLRQIGGLDILIVLGYYQKAYVMIIQ